jgi:hypothetical protein
LEFGSGSGKQCNECPLFSLKKTASNALPSFLTNDGKLQSLISNKDLSVILIGLGFAFEAKQFTVCNGEGPNDERIEANSCSKWRMARC